MFDAFRLRVLLAVGWVVALALFSWGYNRLAAAHDLIPALESLGAAVDAEDWPAAEAAMADFDRQWRTAQRVVEFNFGSQLVEDFDLAFGRLQGALTARHRAGAAMALGELRVQWQGLSSIFPDGK